MMDDGYVPPYVLLSRSGALAERVAEARARMHDCDLCPRACGIDRTRTIRGAVCHTGIQPVVASFGPHHGEEDCLRGHNGSGTVFFSWCNLRCVYCQNEDISAHGAGRPVNAQALAGMMLELQRQGCHNINLVSPSHVIAQVLEAVDVAAKAGLRLPLVFNTGGYDSVSALNLLDGVVDIYLADAKYGSSRVGRLFSKVPDYVEVNRAALREMHRQVGDLVCGGDGVALRGLMVRHLVLPGGLAGSESVLRFLARELSVDTYVNLMSQYSPNHLADSHPPLNRHVHSGEVEEVVALARRFGLSRLDDRHAARRAAGNR